MDVYVLLKVVALHNMHDWIQSRLAHDIGISPSVVNRTLKKAEEIKLYSSAHKSVNIRFLEEALVHGARYFLAPKKGGEVRGIPTAWAAPPLVHQIVSADALPPVWPDPMGEVRGLSVEPLHPSAPRAALNDPRFYELLALLDVLRIGGAREKAIAEKAFHHLLKSPRHENFTTD